MSKVATLEEARMVARDVAEKGAAFNAALRAAREAGLVVDLEAVDVARFGDKWPTREVMAKMAVDL